MHLHAQNLTDGRLPLWRHGRCWWGRMQAEWGVFYRPRLAIGFEKGGHVNDGSGVQIHLALLVFWIYLSMDLARIFGRPYRELKPRDLSAYWYEGSLWLRLWTSDDDWMRDRPWHRNMVALHVVEWIVGRSECTTVKGEPVEAVIPMPEGCYPAILTPEVRTWANRFRTIRRESWDVRIPDGIPFSGKGENSWDCGDDGLYGCGSSGTMEDAIGHTVTSVLKSRRRYGETDETRGRTVMARQGSI
jgi:hypothetical protein